MSMFKAGGVIEGVASLSQVTDLLEAGEVEKSIDAGSSILHLVSFQGGRYVVVSDDSGNGIISKL